MNLGKDGILESMLTCLKYSKHEDKLWNSHILCVKDSFTGYATVP